MSELLNRRLNFFNKMKENSVAILFAGVSKVSSEDEFLPFCINKNFYYFTNIKQENSVLVFVKGLVNKSIYLFIDEYSALKERWTGKRLTNDQAKLISEINNIYSRNQLNTILDLALAKENNQYGAIDTIYIDLAPELKIDSLKSTQHFADEIIGKYPHISIADAYPMVRDLRMVKSSYEIEEIAKAISDTNAGIITVLNSMKPGAFEYELADVFEFYGRKKYQTTLSFNTIVAAGKNATCMHYPTQTDVIRENQLVLFDLGYRRDEYCADISRTYPVSGTFQGKQRDIYEAVLNTNKAVIEFIREGMTLKEINEFTKKFLKNECLRLNLMTEDEDISTYYMHNVSHHLGLDTHDISLRDRPLENGNVITVEPGLYFDKYEIGVRIEDDVAILNGRAELLSKGVKKEIIDIERLLRTKGI